MHKFLPFIIFLCFFSNCRKINETKYDTHKAFKDSIARELYTLATMHPDSAMFLVRCYQSIDSLASDSDFYFHLQQTKGISKFVTGEVDSSIHYFSDCYRYWKNDSSQYGIENQAKQNYNIGFSYENNGDKFKALECYNKVISLNIKTGTNLYKTQIAASLNKSKILMDQDNYEEAIEAIERCITLCAQYKDSTLMISSLQAYADVYTNCGFYDEANQQFNEVLNYKSHFTPISEYVHHNNKGRMYFLQDQYENAKQEFLIAYNLSKELNIYNQFITAMNILEVSLTLNDITTSNEFMKPLQENRWICNGIPAFLFYYNSLSGEYYRQTNNLMQAEKSFQIADSVLAKNEIDNVIKKLHYKRRSNFYFSVGNYKQAFNVQAKYDELNKNILKSDNRRQVSALKYKYERDTTLIAQKNAINIKEEQIVSYKSRQTSLITVTISLLLIIISAYFFLKKKKQLEHEKNIRKIATLKMESIRNRISPHFVFNALNNIWAIIDDRVNAKRQFDNLMNLIRTCLINTEEIAIPLEQEISFVRSYLSLQKQMLNGNLDVEWKISDNTDINTLIPGMILQIPVENAIKHGLAQLKSHRNLFIEIFTADNYLYINVTDNGTGLHSGSSTSKGTGTGLKVLNSTIHLLNGINHQKITFTIQNNTTDANYPGVKTQIKIPSLYNYSLEKTI